MKVKKVRDLKYSAADKSRIDLFVTCDAFGEIATTLNIVDTEDLHHFATGIFDLKTKQEILIPLEEYCMTQKIANYTDPLTLEEKIQVAISELKNNINYESPTECLNINWVGGYESAQMLNAKRTLCLEMDLEYCTFTDSEDTDHVLTLIEAKEVCIKIAQEFEERRIAYKAKKRAIETCITFEELEAILL
jgi:hypothetical protein